MYVSVSTLVQVFSVPIYIHTYIHTYIHIYVMHMSKQTIDAYIQIHTKRLNRNHIHTYMHAYIHAHEKDLYFSGFL